MQAYRKEVNGVNRTDRQFVILSVLWVRKKDTIANLAVEFGVSIRTIKDDVQVIMLYRCFPKGCVFCVCSFEPEC